MSTLVLLRHGESTWNAENRFTGWTDVALSSRGEQEARDAGTLMLTHGALPDVVHTSLLTRAIRSAEITIDGLGRAWLPVRRTWRLNERHYGALQGLNKKDTAARYGVEQVAQWRRGYSVSPPPLAEGDLNDARGDARYSVLPPELVPASESLADVVARVLPYWYDSIVADLANQLRVLVVAHGNSLRALVKHLKCISDDEVVDLNIATGQPWRFELNEQYRVIDDGYLDPKTALEAAERVRTQGDG
jgi:2,3-bisphosphoglycerate-dependent phosphoglycerate mutase